MQYSVQKQTVRSHLTSTLLILHSIYIEYSEIFSKDVYDQLSYCKYSKFHNRLFRKNVSILFQHILSHINIYATLRVGFFLNTWTGSLKASLKLTYFTAGYRVIIRSDS